MELRTWQFTNFSGLRTPPSISAQESTVEVHWLANSNQILIEGVFSTGDETYQVVPKNLILRDEEINIVIGISRIESEMVMDIGRFVPYQIKMEFLSGFPEKVNVTHERTSSKETFTDTI